MRIFDCVMVDRQADLDLLEARFAEYEKIPEIVHVIAEAVTDYYGNPKPAWFREAHEDRFGAFFGKWNHVQVEAHELPDDSPKIRKDALREYLSHAVTAEPDDIILHGGIDEIPAAWVVRDLAAGKIPVPVVMEMRWCAYTPELVHPLPWRGTVAQKWQWTGSFCGLRENRTSLPAIINAGTRLSMLGEEPQDKHPDGHALWETEVDSTYPRWITSK